MNSTVDSTFVAVSGLGSLFAGALLGLDLEIDEIFLVFAGLGMVAALLLGALYHVFGKRSEQRLVAKKQELVERATLKRKEQEMQEEEDPKAQPQQDDEKGEAGDKEEKVSRGSEVEK